MFAEVRGGAMKSEASAVSLTSSAFSENLSAGPASTGRTGLQIPGSAVTKQASDRSDGSASPGGGSPSASPRGEGFKAILEKMQAKVTKLKAVGNSAVKRPKAELELASVMDEAKDFLKGLLRISVGTGRADQKSRLGDPEVIDTMKELCEENVLGPATDSRRVAVLKEIEKVSGVFAIDAGSDREGLVSRARTARSQRQAVDDRFPSDAGLDVPRPMRHRAATDMALLQAADASQMAPTRSKSENLLEAVHPTPQLQIGGVHAALSNGGLPQDAAEAPACGVQCRLEERGEGKKQATSAKAAGAAPAAGAETAASQGTSGSPPHPEAAPAPAARGPVVTAGSSLGKQGEALLPFEQTQVTMGAEPSVGSASAHPVGAEAVGEWKTSQEMREAETARYDQGRGPSFMVDHINRQPMEALEELMIHDAEDFEQNERMEVVETARKLQSEKLGQGEDLDDPELEQVRVVDAMRVAVVCVMGLAGLASSALEAGLPGFIVAFFSVIVGAGGMELSRDSKAKRPSTVAPLPKHVSKTILDAMEREKTIQARSAA